MALAQERGYFFPSIQLVADCLCSPDSDLHARQPAHKEAAHDLDARRHENV
jgi:hypothetical protein